MRVQVYRNLHKNGKDGSVYSIRDKSTRLVIDHRGWIILDNAKFHVSAKGRARVLREKAKNVHAWVEGDLCEFSTAASARRRAKFLKFLAKERGNFEFKSVTYNPYKYDCFVFKETEDGISSAPTVIISPLGVYASDTP
jgi:hypothetical protein